MTDKPNLTKFKSLEDLPLRKVVDKGLPALYYQLADVFRRRIEDGEWQVDAQIPTLDDLVAEFGAARATVRQALTILEGEGLLARYRGRGTFVLKRPTRDAVSGRAVSGLDHDRDDRVVLRAFAELPNEFLGVVKVGQRVQVGGWVAGRQSKPYDSPGE